MKITYIKKHLTLAAVCLLLFSQFSYAAKPVKDSGSEIEVIKSEELGQ